MNEGLIQIWNKVVGPNDRVLVLGDMAMGKMDESLPLIGRLNGYKVLVAGNHDRCATMHGTKAEGWTEKYLKAGFDEVHQETIRIDLGKGHSKTLACHFPYSGDSRHEDRYADQRPKDTGEFLVHGHVHDLWLQNGRQINVGLDAWGGAFTTAEEVVDLIEAGPREIGSIPWPS